MRDVRRFHLQAIFCGLSVLVCVLISRPFTTMSVCDDGLYILMAQTLANTGHIVYNGWAASFDYGPNDWGYLRIECIGGYDSW